MTNKQPIPDEMLTKGIEATRRGDFGSALGWLINAAENGHAYAAWSAAAISEAGMGVRRDRSKAILLYRVAARGGLKAAQARLKQLYRDDLIDAAIILSVSTMLYFLYWVYHASAYFQSQHREWVDGLIQNVFLWPLLFSIIFVVDRSVRLAFHTRTYRRWAEQSEPWKPGSLEATWPTFFVAFVSFQLIGVCGIAVMLLTAPNSITDSWYGDFAKGGFSLEAAQAGCLAVIVAGVVLLRTAAHRGRLRPVTWVAGVMAALYLVPSLLLLLPSKHSADLSMLPLAIPLGGTALAVCLLCIFCGMRAARAPRARAEDEEAGAAGESP